jgi:hypothetical protein
VTRATVSHPQIAKRLFSRHFRMAGCDTSRHNCPQK